MTITITFIIVKSILFYLFEICYTVYNKMNILKFKDEIWFIVEAAKIC